MSKERPSRQKHVPQRTCVVCRQKKDKRELTRVVRTSDEGVVVDPTGKRNGRGAYLCSDSTCWDQVAASGRLLNQALKTNLSRADLAAIAAQKPVPINHLRNQDREPLTE